MGSTLTYFFLRKISKSISKSPEIILADKNLNWVNVLEVGKSLLPLETTMF